METAGVVTAIRPGPARLEDPVVWVDEQPLTMLSRWPVRDPRPVAGRLDPSTPLITGQRAIDVLFPLARGGAATIPGGFGTGKTVLQQSLAKWAHADVVIYVGCGERGNELTEVLEDFPQLVDPRTGASLMERTIMVANTSNMPVAAREASIYTGVTMAEYFRDQGYQVALMADSTSRWGEALREVSAGWRRCRPRRAIPPTCVAAGRVLRARRRGPLPGSDAREGSVTIIGAVSPPGGDFSEPITQHSLRLAGMFWALDTTLARQRHFPAIDWNRSYTLYDSNLVRARGRRRLGGAARLGSRAAPARGAAARGRPAPRPDTLAPPERLTLAPAACCARTSSNSPRSTSATHTARRPRSWRCCGRSGAPTRP